MLLPPSGPTSTWTALGRRFSEENWLRIPWAVTRSGEPADASTATASAVPTALVQALKLCSREVRRQYLAVVFARPPPAYGPPLAQPPSVPPPPPSRPTQAHHRRERARQYTAQLCTVPLLAPPEARRDLAVVAPAAARIRDGAQIRPGLRRLEHLFHPGGAGPAGGVEVGVDDLPIVGERLPRRPPHRLPHVGRLARHPVVHLIADLRPR